MDGLGCLDLRILSCVEDQLVALDLCRFICKLFTCGQQNTQQFWVLLFSLMGLHEFIHFAFLEPQK